MRWIGFTLSCLAIFLLAPLPAGAAIASGANPWTYTTLNYRREVALPSDSAHTRTNVPIWIDLKQLGTVDLATIKAEEISGSTPVACAAAVYAQPSGRDPRAFWIASGTTAAGQTRRFLIYYNKTSTPPAYPFKWSRSGATFGAQSLVVTGTRTVGTRFSYTLTGDRLEFMRTGRDPDKGTDPNHGFFYERNSDYNSCTDLKNGYEPMGGIKTDYVFYGPGADVTEFSSAFYDQIQWDRNGPTAAFSAHYSLSAPQAHKSEVTHRIFQSVPVMEYALTASPNSGAPLEFSNDTFHARRFYWDNSTFSFDRMLTDLGYDGSVSEDGKSKNWIILCNSSGYGFGIFTFEPGKKRVKDGALQEYMNLASNQASVYVYLGVGKKDELKLLFDTMKRGYSLGAEQSPYFNIMEPGEDRHYIPGEAISAVVAGPSIATDLTLRVDYPDGSYKTQRPAKVGNTNAFDLGTVGATSKFGTWTLTASAGSTKCVRHIHVSNPDHPRLVFTQSELKTMQAQWKSDSGYQRVRSRLIYKANDALAAAGPPSTLGTGVGPRFYVRSVMSLASILLLDPAVPQASTYRSRMWSDWKTIVGWAQFNPIGNGVAYFKGDDVERCEALQELASVFDWFFTDLSVTDRRKYADRFADFADAILDCDYANLSYPRWDTWNQITNNRMIFQCAALAGLERLLAPEVPAARRDRWRKRADALFTNLTTMSLCPDGTWNEGESYHVLGLLGLMFWSEVNRLNTGSTAFYSTVPWFREMPNYVLYGMIPGRIGNFGGMLPFGNTDPEPYFSAQAVLGVSGMRGNKVAQWISENIDYDRVESFQAVWQDLSKPVTDPYTLDNWHLFYKRGIFVYRSNWTDQAVYFAAKCGEYWGGHEHPDTGTFVIHRNGFPYIAAPHYVAKTMSEDENILMANGKTIRGRSSDMYSEAVDPAYWGRTLRALGSPDGFDLLQNPAPAYEDGSLLKTYNREFVGVGDTVLLRDTISASAASTFKLLQHGYQTDPQTEANSAYDPNQYPNSQVFVQTATANKIRLYPNRAAAPNESMAIVDLSRSKWSATIGPWKLAPQDVPGYIQPGADRRGNSGASVYTRGGQLTRTIGGVSAATALQVFSFRGDNMTWRAWSGAVADDGAIMAAATNANDVRFKVVWPKGGKMTNVSGAEGLSVTGSMALRNYENKDFGGRDLTYLRDDSALGERAVLLSATAPVTLISKTASGLGKAWIICDKAVSVTLYCPLTVYKAYYNTRAVAFTSSGNYKTFSLPASPWGGELSINSVYKPTSPAGAWAGYE